MAGEFVAAGVLAKTLLRQEMRHSVDPPIQFGIGEAAVSPYERGLLGHSRGYGVEDGRKIESGHLRS